MTASTSAHVPRKRAETRRRLLDAARALLLAQGLPLLTVDAVSRAAGYTRGAFYSNFSSIEELVFALYEQHTDQLVDRLQVGAASIAVQHGGSLEESIRRVIVLVPFDVEWFQIRAGFAAQASRDPALALQFLEHETRFRERLAPILLQVLAAAGRTPSVEAELFTRAMIAAHDGALANGFGEPDPDEVRVLLCTAVASALSADAAQSSS